MLFISRLLSFCVTFLWHGVFIYRASKKAHRDGQELRIAKLQSRAGAALCRALGVRVTLNGNVPVDKPTLIVSNHPGFLDPWVVASRFVTSMVAKAEMNHWPVFGPIGRACGLIFVDRENRMQASDLVDRIQDRMRNGIAVLVFPEGTTSGKDTVLDFKTGAFAAVERMPGAIVLPVYLWAEKVDGVNSDEISRKRIYWPRGVGMIAHVRHLFSIKSLDIEILVGAPIQTERYGRKELAQIAQKEIETLERATRYTGSNSIAS